MSCDYPCHICNPEEWEEEMNRPPTWEEIEEDVARAFGDAIEAFNRADKRYRATKFEPRGCPLWWEPIKIPGYPEEWGFEFNREVDDVWSDGTGIPRSFRATLITREDTYLTYRGERHRILEYVQRIDDGEYVKLAEVYSFACPPWGSWMPSARNLDDN